MDEAEPEPSGPFCVVWVHADSPDVFERAARYARQNLNYGMMVVVVFTEAGARLLQTDRMARMLMLPGIQQLVDELDRGGASFELDLSSARRVGVVETLTSLLPSLRIADPARLAELATGTRMTARYG
ncbi:MAG: DsrE family protein [Alphaproteobacteria bacterium]|nr:DsrE family protein [Alphaproteobacteria bacterium]MCB9698503.1 DsrE family protein [Alphaproteobacteria bacterium]